MRILANLKYAFIAGSFVVGISLCVIAWKLTGPIRELDRAARDIEGCGGIVNRIVFTPKYVSFSGPQIESQIECAEVPLEQAWSVDQVTLSEGKIGNRTLRRLQRMKSLNVLILHDITVSDKDFEKYRETLPNVEIHRQGGWGQAAARRVDTELSSISSLPPGDSERLGAVCR